MITPRTARFNDECMATEMVFGDVCKIGNRHGMSSHSALVAFRNLCKWGMKKRITGGHKIIGKSERFGIVEFDSMADAERGGYDRRCILSCFKGRQKTHAGYTWEKITDAEDRQKARGKAASARQGVRDAHSSVMQQGDAEHMVD